MLYLHDLLRQLLDLFVGSQAVHLLFRLHEDQSEADERLFFDVTRFELLVENEDIGVTETCPINHLVTIIYLKRAYIILCLISTVNEFECVLLSFDDNNLRKIAKTVLTASTGFSVFCIIIRIIEVNEIVLFFLFLFLYVGLTNSEKKSVELATIKKL